MNGGKVTVGGRIFNKNVLNQENTELLEHENL
jgi:ribulose 1,5-bisphosphate synthetase/thiazole synthase